jgi:uncharacterized protein YdeI (YjbR/CyaY-like superfamily)
VAARKPDPKTIRAFASPKAFEAWLGRNHARASEVWIKIFKKASGKPSIDASQALDVALCFGWIDGLRLGFDDEAFLQRYSPRTPKSRWSQLNVARVKRLLAAGRMTPHGQRQIDAAKADGRWQAAYPSPSAIEVPEDFAKALAKNKKALAAFGALGRQQRGVIAYRLYHVKSAARRVALIAEVVAELADGKRQAKLSAQRH